ncbi:hypothetical protein HG1285_10988 [Hydrogenivirga sp. 128-5-R1-1]|nr:hypothetical protein HG1285_10988 [Hydrogenivirga sp. 128-5-R1-1]
MKREIQMLRILLLLFFLSSCGYKPVNFEKQKLNVCIEKVNINSPEPLILDVLNRKLRDVIVSQGKKLDCSYKKNIVVYITLKSLSFYPIGYSQSQRANVYKIAMSLNLKVDDKEGSTILNKDITETTQYIGAGLRADIEKRYAIQYLGDLIQVRIFSLLSQIR